MRHVIFLTGIWPNDLAFINTKFTRSIGCYQLKHWLSMFNIQSQVIDYCQILTADDILLLLEQFISKETIAIGFSTTFWPLNKSIPPNLLEVIRRVKEKWPHVKLISGGARQSDHPNLFYKHFSGESENNLLVWCQEQIGKNALSAFNKKFDITTLSHRFTEADAILDDEALPIELGRGCIFKCKFCAHHNLGKPKYTYQRHFDLIVDEIRHNYEKFGTTKYMFTDDTVNEDVDKIKNFSTISQQLGFNIDWIGYLRADLVWSKPETAEMLINSGMKSCFFGIETFHPEAGKSINKGWASKYGKEYLPKLYSEIWGKEVNIHVNLIAGLPYEKLSSLNETLEWAKQNPIGFYRFAPLALYIDRNDPNTSSEFTKNYPQYGYRNVNIATGYWESDTMNYSEAHKFCNDSVGELAKINRISSWDVFNGTNLGFKTKDVMTWKIRTFHQVAALKAAHFKSMYLEKLKSISN